MHRRGFLQLAAAGAGAISLSRLAPLAGAAAESASTPIRKPAPIYCCIFLEFIQPWEQNEALRRVKELGLGNVVALTETFHVGNSDADRSMWKQHFPELAAQIDAVPQFLALPEHGHAAAVLP